MTAGVSDFFEDPNASSARYGMLTSSDGITWNTVTSMAPFVWYSVCSQRVIVGSGAILSPANNGAGWSVRYFQESSYYNLLSVVWAGSQFVAVGFKQDTTSWAGIVTSPDGINWTVRNSGISTPAVLSSVAWTGNQLVAVGFQGYYVSGISSIVLTSPDGITWTPRTLGTAHALNSIIWAGNQFVAVGDSGTILTSPDGITWTAKTSGTSNILESVTWTGSQFVAVGLNGTILTSPQDVIPIVPHLSRKNSGQPLSSLYLVNGKKLDLLEAGGSNARRLQTFSLMR
jgi:hypothetical protein